MSPPRPVALVEAHPLYPVLTSMPGVGVPAAAVFLAETAGRTFPTGAQLASYAGLTPVTRRSGSSIRGEYVSHAGNKRLKRAMFLSAFASLHSDPASRAYYERKRAQGKRLGPGRTRPRPPPHPDPIRHGSETAPSTTPNQPSNYPPPLDKPHRGTPPE